MSLNRLSPLFLGLIFLLSGCNSAESELKQALMASNGRWKMLSSDSKGRFGTSSTDKLIHFFKAISLVDSFYQEFPESNSRNEIEAIEKQLVESLNQQILIKTAEKLKSRDSANRDSKLKYQYFKSVEAEYSEMLYNNKLPTDKLLNRSLFPHLHSYDLSFFPKLKALVEKNIDQSRALSHKYLKGNILGQIERLKHSSSLDEAEKLFKDNTSLLLTYANAHTNDPDTKEMGIANRQAFQVFKGNLSHYQTYLKGLKNPCKDEEDTKFNFILARQFERNYPNNNFIHRLKQEVDQLSLDLIKQKSDIDPFSITWLNSKDFEIRRIMPYLLLKTTKTKSEEAIAQLDLKRPAVLQKELNRKLEGLEEEMKSYAKKSLKKEFNERLIAVNSFDYFGEITPLQSQQLSDKIRATIIYEARLNTGLGLSERIARYKVTFDLSASEKTGIKTNRKGELLYYSDSF